MTQPNGDSVRKWLLVGIAFLGPLLTAAWFSSSYATRLAAVEKALDQKVEQREFNDLKDRLTRIEDKLDRALRSK